MSNEWQTESREEAGKDSRKQKAGRESREEKVGRRK
jgi:hypothetical protein